jgi:copper chaperone CopZ
MKTKIKANIKNIVKATFVLVFVALLNGCCVSNMKEITIDVHDANIENQFCLKSMEEAFKTLPGNEFIKIKALPEENAISVTYDAMQVGRKNLEDALAKKGFDAGEYKADPVARSLLPVNWFTK